MILLTLSLFLSWPSHWNLQPRKIKNKTELYDKRDDFTFPIVNFPFISSNIPAVTSVWILHFTTHIILRFVPSIVIFCTKLSCWHKSYSNKTMLLLGWSLRYTILRSSSRIGWPLRTIKSSSDDGTCALWLELCPLSPTRRLPDLAMSNLAGVVYEIGTAYPSQAVGFNPEFLMGSVLLMFLVFFCFLCPMFPVSLDCLFLNVLWFSLTFFVVASKLNYRDREYIVPLLSFAKTDIQIFLSWYLVLLRWWPNRLPRKTNTDTGWLVDIVTR